MRAAGDDGSPAVSVLIIASWELLLSSGAWETPESLQVRASEVVQGELSYGRLNANYILFDNEGASTG